MSVFIDSLRASWSDGSFFIVSMIESFEIFRGTCDSAGEREFSFFRKQSAFFSHP